METSHHSCAQEKSHIDLNLKELVYRISVDFAKLDELAEAEDHEESAAHHHTINIATLAAAHVSDYSVLTELENHLEITKLLLSQLVLVDW